jgi:hypothetical protein
MFAIRMNRFYEWFSWFSLSRARPITLPSPLRSGLEAAVRPLLEPGDRPPIDFS